MKRKITVLFSLLFAVVFSALCLFACGKSEGDVKATVVESSETLLVIRVDKTDGKATLYDAMKYLREEEEIDFESQSSTYGEMLKSINGKASDEGSGAYWMSYTSDADFSNAAWGSYHYGDKELGSCSIGMSSLTVKEGCLYVWVYQSF